MIHCLEFPAGTWYSGSCPNTTCTRGNATSNPPILGNESQCSCGIGCAPSACFNPSREVVFKAFNDQAQELVPFVANGTIAGIFFGTDCVTFSLCYTDCTNCPLTLVQTVPVRRAGDEISCTSNVPFATVDEGTRRFRSALTAALEAHTPGLSKRVFYATNECQNTLGCAPPPHTCPGCTPGCGTKNGEYHPWCVTTACIVL